MKALRLFILTTTAAASLMTMISSCCRQPTQVWDDTKSCGRHMSRGIRSLGGKHGDSRQVCCKEEFVGWDEAPIQEFGYRESEFTAIPEQQYPNDIAMAEYVAPQPRETPGDPGSSIPGIQAFRDPATIPGMANVFQNIHFDYNSNLIRGQENFDIIHSVSNYLRTHSNVYIFVEGHTDERGAEAYNLSLGSRRSNSVRNALIQEGVNPDNIFTISYGKERPLVLDSNEESWSQNRRAEFKIYQR